MAEGSGVRIRQRPFGKSESVAQAAIKRKAIEIWIRATSPTNRIVIRGTMTSLPLRQSARMMPAVHHP